MKSAREVILRSWRALHPLNSSADNARPGKRPAVSISLAILSGLTATEIIRQGAFYPADAFTVTVVSLGLILGALLTGIDRRAVWVMLAVGTCTLWWLFSAVYHGPATTFFPLGASMVGFLAAFLVVRGLDQVQRLGAAVILATIGAAASAIGLVASVMRWYPLAMPAQNLWRLSTTLTYSDAAGMLLGMALLIAVALDQRRWFARVDVALCMAGLVATQSRGAALGVLVGGAIMPLAAARHALRPILAGLGGGLLVVGTSSGPTHQPVVGMALGVIVVVGGVVPSSLRRPRLRLSRITRRQALIVAIGGLVVAGFALAALHTPIQRRVELASTGDRITEWHAAFDQWRSSPGIGVGPDLLLTFHAVDGTYAHYAHNEYLQILADAGAVGGLLLLVAIGTVVIAIRREDTISSCAAASLVVFAVTGALDFDWHLAALGLVGGWAAGLASPPVSEGAEGDGT